MDALVILVTLAASFSCVAVFVAGLIRDAVWARRWDSQVNWSADCGTDWNIAAGSGYTYESNIPMLTVEELKAKIAAMHAGEVASTRYDEPETVLVSAADMAIMFADTIAAPVVEAAVTLIGRPAVKTTRRPGRALAALAAA